MTIFTGIQSHDQGNLQNNSHQKLQKMLFISLDLMTVYQSNQFNLGGYKAKHVLYTLDKVSYYNKQDG